MSMNLNLEGFSLWQTPTQITYMCVTQPDGSTPYELTGKKARHAIEIYRQWVIGSQNGYWETVEASRQHSDGVNNHINRLDEFLKSNKKIRVWVM